ncbi:MAG: molybdopterin cofactor-binding domain-containing protein [Myxococcota bacterium]
MSQTRTIARRTFLIGSVAVTGGVIFGGAFATRPAPNPLLDDLAEGEAAITPYVKIDANGITFITPRADKGQGAYSAQARLIAEELDIDPAKVRLDPGQPAQAYYNAEVMAEGLPVPGYERGWLVERVRDGMQIIGRLQSFQITGGSSTVPEMFHRLRLAGAVARETLKKAAAVRFGVDVAALRTEDGAVVLPDETRVPYTDLATLAAQTQPVKGVPLRPPEQWRLIGKPMRRLDVVDKSTGRQQYGIDLRLPGMLYATARANPGLGGDVVSMDTSAAEAMRGVRKIVPIPHGVVVIADNTWRAFKAAEAIQITWGPGPYPASTDKMWDVLTASMTPDRQNSQLRDDGDVDKALTDCETTVEAEYRTPYLAHAPLEPMNATVQVTEDAIDVWTGTQIPAHMRRHIAERTGYPEDRIRIHGQMMGGSFGRRLEDTYVMQALEAAMAIPDTPIKMTWSREEDMTHDYPRPMALGWMRGGLKDGKIAAFDVRCASQSLSASWFGRLDRPLPGPDEFIVAGAIDQPYAITNSRVTGYAAPEMVPVSSWRSVGASSNSFLHEGFLDELMVAGGVDPMEERLRLVHHMPSRKVLEAVAEMCNWKGTDLGPDRGRGLAFCYAFGVPVAEVVDVTMTPAGLRIDKVYVAADVGTVINPTNVRAQLSGGVIWGLGHAIQAELVYQNHAPIQTNYHTYPGMRIYQTPEIEVRALENAEKVCGIGEPGVPPAAPALANAIFAATGERLREMPFRKFIDFV